MPDNRIRRLILLGGIVIIGIIFTQTYILMKTWDVKDQEFDQSIRIMLTKVAQRISTLNETELPKTGLIRRTSSNYYAVNIHTSIDATILEDYLIQEMTNHSIKTDFEYGVYDCHTGDLVYGNYCKMTDTGITTPKKKKTQLAPLTGLEYHFVVSFPSRGSYLISNIRMTLLFAAISILAVVFFLYMIWIILRQKKLSERQKDFINNMTHEFKTPLSSIKIASDFLAQNGDIASQPRLLKYTNIIRDQNTRLTKQVEKVLNLAKLEEDNFSLSKESIDLQKTLEKIVESENMRLKHPRISLHMETRPTISADLLHFTNVATNILDNAIKYSGPEDKVDVTVSETKESVILHFSDEGIGMKKEDLSNIFEKFYRVSTGNVHNVKGFGLGLFYVKNICDAHNWQLDVESVYEKGSTFIITIPKQHE